MSYRDAFFIYKVQNTDVSVFYHKPNSDMWESQKDFFLRRARRTPDVTSRNARLSRYARATLTDATLTDASDDAIFFFSFL